MEEAAALFLRKDRREVVVDAVFFLFMTSCSELDKRSGGPQLLGSFACCRVVVYALIRYGFNPNTAMIRLKTLVAFLAALSQKLSLHLSRIAEEAQADYRLVKQSLKKIIYLV